MANGDSSTRQKSEISRAALLRSSLPTRTFVGFVAAFFAVGVIAFLSYRGVEERRAQVERLTTTMRALEHLERLALTAKDAETGQRGYLLTGDEKYLEPFDTAVSTMPLEIEKARESLRGTAAQNERLEHLELLFEKKFKELNRTIELKRVGDDEGALRLVRTDTGKTWMDQIRALLREMRIAEQKRLEDRTVEWQNATQLFALTTWTGAGVLAFLIGAALVLSSRDFRDQRVQAWLQVGQRDLAQRLQGNQSIERVADNVALFLSEYLDALAGVVYFASFEGGLRRVGTFAAPRVDPAGIAVAPGSLTLQTFQDNDIREVHDVPSDYFSVGSALGAARPKHLLVAATTLDGTPNGVLELAFFHPVTRHDVELVRRVTETIGIALRSAWVRQEMQNLLEETQRQGEELQTQQEELRVANEELEQQSRILQTSQEQLKNQQAELEQVNSQLEEQAQALEIQRDDLMDAQGELERASTYKSEFLANMSHELRTPLNSSLILAKLLSDNREHNLTPEQVKFAETIYSAGSDLLVLINDILDLSKIEAGKLDVHPENVQLERLRDSLVDVFQPLAKEKGLALSMTIEAGAPAALRTDPTRLLQILKNLLSNAVKFTEQGSVTLRIRKASGQRVVFEVEDTGIGIREDQHDTIFEAFRQADGTTNRKYGGTGLGLSISRDLSKLLGGSLELSSQPGKGSTFTLTLPLDLPDDVVVAVAQEMPVRATRSAPPKKPEPRQESDLDSLPAGTRSLLVIEDDPAFAHIVRDLAKELGFTALVAHDAETGLVLAKRHRPNAVVLDIGLPDRSGLTVLDALKQDSATRHIPVHVVSALDYTRTALEMGATGYAIKPVQREKLIDAIERLETKFSQSLRRVLVVEDDDIHREATCKLLSASDVECIAVRTAAEALEKLTQLTFDCMVLDLKLPDQSGFDLLDEMSQREQFSFPPVIVYTGRSLSREEEQRLRRYSSSIIIKGARSPERLLDEVTLFLHQVESELPPDRQRMLRDARHREAVFEGRRILIVEDDVRSLFALTSVLEPRGAKVEIARNGKEALAHLINKPGVDLVLMDVMMPEMDGLEATREIRKNPDNAKLPIIALTAKAMSDDRDQCLAAGMNDYVAKPLDVDKLLSLVRVWLPK